MSIEDFYFKYPWEHYVFDNFLDDNTLFNVLKFIEQYQYDFQIDKNDIQKIQYSLNFDNRLNEIFISKSFKKFLEYVTNSNVEFYEENFVQLRKMDETSPVFSKHTDIVDNQKSFVVILYLTKNWSKKNKGELLLYEKFSTPKKEAKIIEPILNRLVILPTSKKNWHSVERVKGTVRYSIIQEWIAT